MAQFGLAGLFTSHLVLQRGRSNPLWGWAEPGQRIAVTVEGPTKFEPVTVTTLGTADGCFRVELPVLPEGGPYRIRVVGSKEILLSDVLVGEVWLASGQSNMEWKVSSSSNAADEMAKARFGQIRQIKIPNCPASAEEECFEAQWRVCSPENVGDFSAVGYLFAREIHQRLGVPVGIIDASWGGTYIESWTSLEGLRPVMPELAEELAEAALQTPRIDEIRAEYQDRLRSWERNSLPADPGNLGMLDGWANTDFDDQKWKSMTLPRFWQAAGLAFNGVVWFRKSVDVPKSWVGRELILRLGTIDDFDNTYFNGVLIGEHPDGTPEAHQIKREYRIPGNLVRAGRNVIAVRVFDHCGEGGFGGPAIDMCLCKAEGSSKTLALSGEWKFAVELEIPLVSMSVFATFPPPPKALAAQHAPAALYHGMIAPLVPYGLCGFLFYQGENNVESYASYRDRLVAMIRDWRTRFGQGTLPFLLVQLAGYAANDAWPHLREAQAQASDEPGCYLATAIDVGEENDIHPKNKQAVADRLARLALANCYGQKDVRCYGPRFRRYALEGRSVRVYLDHAEGLCSVDGCAEIKGFALAGKDGQFHPAVAKTDGETVVASAAEVTQPVAVRYAWKDYQELNLINGAGLPALPFRTDGASPL